MRSVSSLLLACLLAGTATAAIANLEKALTKRCPRGYVHFAETNRCYSVYRDNKTYTEAREACENEDAKLVSIHSKAENDFVSTLTSAAYIGMQSKTGDEQNYGWIDGTETDFTAWADGEPSNYRDFLENCVELFGRYDFPWIPGMWNNIPCRHRQPFICEVPAVESEDDDDVLNMTMSCEDDDYKFFNGTNTCFKLYNDNTKTAAEATQQCADDGGQLATIHSEEENEFLAEMAKSIEAAVYIGLHSKTEDEKNYKWNDGTKLDYTSWAPKEPSKRKENVIENCVTLYGDWADEKWNHKWNNERCDQRLNFVCAKDAGAPRIPEPPFPKDEGHPTLLQIPVSDKDVLFSVNNGPLISLDKKQLS